MHVFKKKKSKRNKDSHVKNFNRQNFSFMNYDYTKGFNMAHSTQTTHSTKAKGIFLMTILTIFFYFSLSLVYNIALVELNYDILSDVAKLIDTSDDYTLYGSEAVHSTSLGGLLNKIKVLNYCL
jgi:hypothetical protein